MNKKFNINVTLKNSELVKNLYLSHGDFAKICYDTEGNEKVISRVGKNCSITGHMSGSRCEYFKFEIEADRGTIEEIQRHEIGTNYWPEDKYADFDYQDFIGLRQNIPADEIVKNSQSFRYCAKNNFNYIIPENISSNTKALKIYQEVMDAIDKTRVDIRELLMQDGIDEKRAVEDSNLILPRATMSKIMLGLTPEALIRFCWKRLCVRAQPFIREVALGMKEEVEKYNPDFAKQLMPHCQYLTWCPEGKKSCGAYPTREQRLTQVQLENYYKNPENFKEEDK